MKIEYVKWFSPHLSKDMELKVFGSQGKAMLVFPTSQGRFFDFEDRGMVSALTHWLDAQKLKLYCVDSVDGESFFHQTKSLGDKVGVQSRYEDYIMKEVVPYIYSHGHYGQLMLYGASWGAFHAMLLLLKYPQVFDECLCLSGIYDLQFIQTPTDVYFYNPIEFLRNIEDQTHLGLICRARITLCCGQGKYEDDCLASVQQFAQLLKAKKIPHTLEIWSKESHHDWDWWNNQLEHFLAKLFP